MKNRALAAIPIPIAFVFVACWCSTASLRAQTNWTVQNSGSIDHLYGVTFAVFPDGTSRFCAVGTNSASTVVLTSPDGVAWTRQTTGVGGALNSVVYNNGRYVAVGTNSANTIVLTSPDGVTWTPQNFGAGGILHDVNVGWAEGYAAVGGTTAQGMVGRSVDASTWNRAFPGPGEFYAVLGTGSRTFAIGSFGAIAESVQGGAWTGKPAITSGHLYDLDRVPLTGIIAIVGESGTTVRSTDFGSNWTIQTSVTNNHLHAVVYDDRSNHFVAVGTNGALVLSDDNGASWFNLQPVTADHLHAVASGHDSIGLGLIVAVGTDGRIITSESAITGGSGSLTVEPGTDQFGYEGGCGVVSMTAVGGDVVTSVFTSAPWIRLTWADQTIAEDDSAGAAYEVLQNGDANSRSAIIYVHGATTHQFSVSQGGGPPFPPIPSGGEVGGRNMDVTWNQGGGADSFRGERRVNGGMWSPAATFSGNTTVWSESGLAPLTLYEYRLFGINTNGESEPSSTFGGYTTPDPPGDLAVTAHGWSQTLVTWSDMRGITEYYLERRFGAGGQWESLGVPLPSGTNAFCDSALPAGEEIFYRMTVRSGNPYPRLWSVPSAEVSAILPPYAGQLYWGDAEDASIPTDPGQSDLFGAAYGNGRYVAVGGRGEIVSSPDGIVWTIEPSNAANTSLTDVAYGSSHFVVCGENGVILTSTGDGNWTPRASDTTSALGKIAHGTGRFLVTAAPSDLLTSTDDGLTWSTLGGALPSGATDLAFGDGEFVLAAFDGINGRLWNSTDGWTWLESRNTGGGFGAWRTAIAWSSSRWLTGGFGTNFDTSTDGQNWTTNSNGITDAFLERVSGIAGNNSQFAASTSSGRIVTTADTAAWAESLAPGAIPLWAIAHGGAGFVSVGASGVIRHSASGASGSWTETRAPVPPEISGQFDSVAYGAGTAIAVGQQAGIGVLYRRNPATREWEPIDPGLAPLPVLLRVSFAHGNFFIGGTGGLILRSPDGLTWTNVGPPGSSESFRGVAYHAGRHVALGAETVYYSDDDGETWQNDVVGQFQAMNFDEIAYGGDRFLAVGLNSNGSIRASHDGRDWANSAPITVIGHVGGIVNASSGAIAYGLARQGRDLWVYGTMNHHYVSADGSFWQRLDGGVGAVTYGGGVFVASFNDAPRLRASTDGVNWTPMPAGFLPSDPGLSHLAYGGANEFTGVAPDFAIHTFKVSHAPLADTDSDGISDAIEDAGPNGGDGNNDGTQDSQQAHVASLPNQDGTYLTLAAPPGTVLVDVAAVHNPSPGNSPRAAAFPFGFLRFRVTGLALGGSISLDLHFPPTITLNAYFKFGGTQADPAPHWYAFDYDATTNTGAVIQSGMLTLHLTDGAHGDDNLTADGVIVDDGGPSFVIAPPSLIDFARLPDGSIRIVIDTIPGVNYAIEISDDLIWFAERLRMVASGEQLEVIDPPSNNVPRRFYRIVRLD